MKILISDSNPYAYFLEPDGNKMTISITEDEYQSDDEEIYDEINSMSGGKLKKLLMLNPEKLEDLQRIIKKKSKNRELRGGKSFRVLNKSLHPLPRTDLDREIIYIFGPSGSGKSHYTKKYADEYVEKYPNNKIFMFSRIPFDETLNGLDMVRLPMDEETLKNLSIFDLENSLCIFDDTDSVSKSKVAQLVDKLKDDIAQTGRHAKISCIITTHMACNYNKTRVILNETHKFVIFPQSGSSAQNKYLLEKYGGLEKKEILRVLKIPSRWLTFSVNYPKHLMHENGIELIE